jgi:hypothetical protein
MKTLSIALALTFLSSFAHADLTAAKLKECFANTKTKFLSTPGKTNVVYRFKGSDVYKITLAQPGPFAASAMSKGVCFDRESTEALATKECKEAKSVLKLDGYSLNEAYEAVMEDYKSQITEFMESAMDTPEKEDLRAQVGEVKAMLKQLETCEKLGPLSTFAKKKLSEANDAAAILRSTYSIKDETADAPPHHASGAKANR